MRVLLRSAKEQGGSYTGFHYFKLYPSDKSLVEFLLARKIQRCKARNQTHTFELRGKDATILPGWAHNGLSLRVLLRARENYLLRSCKQPTILYAYPMQNPRCASGGLVREQAERRH